MAKEIQDAIQSLEDLKNSIIKGFNDDRPLNEIWGWNFPCFTRTELADFAGNLSLKLSEININEIEDEVLKQISKIPTKVLSFKKTTLKYIFNGNGNQGVPVYLSLIQWIENAIEPLFDWELLLDKNALPKNLANKIRSIQSTLNEIVPVKDELLAQITLINNATESAENLPTDLESLKEAKIKVDKISTDSAEIFGKIDTYLKSCEINSKSIELKKDEAEKLILQCEEAYKVTTTKGLAGAFHERAKNLSISMWLWVVGLILALGFGVYIGTHRFEILNDSMKSDVEIKYIWVQILLSVLSLGGPIWLAWLATKQIGQRFKLSEDYAFKSSVAKAYEGYRREAAKLDQDLELRLFSSALSRLEEAPLRLMENEHHGSPWHELISSTQFQKALQDVPELKEKLISIIKPKANTQHQQEDK